MEQLTPRFERVVVVCPEHVSGGPEALHQLAHCINRLGGNAQMAYTWGESEFIPTGHGWQCLASEQNRCLRAYAHYSPLLAGGVVDDPGTCVVFPEVMTRLATLHPNAKYRKLVWWLSVDVAYQFNPDLGVPYLREEFFRTPGIVHAWQSNFAKQYLVGSGVRDSMPLSDYIGMLYRLQVQLAGDRRHGVAVYMGRSCALQDMYMQRNREHAYYRIQGMKPPQVIQTLRQCGVYLDFGASTGKDRVPREAALQGCVVFLHASGANADPEDHPLDPYYRFTAHDVAEGTLQRKVCEVLQNHGYHYAAQYKYHAVITQEPAVFEQQVRRLFFQH